MEKPTTDDVELEGETQKHESPPSGSEPRVDGGVVAWSQVVAGHLTTFNSWGYISSYGLFQAYYAHLLRRPPSAISWVGSVQIFLTFLISTLSTHSFNAGCYRTVLAVGLVVQILGVFATSACREYWQFFLAQGLCQGIGMGLTFAPTVSLVSSYFVKYRAIAVAGIACGMSTGGVVFPLIARQMLPSAGFSWTLRVMGFVFVANSCVGFALLRPRTTAKTSRPILDESAFRDPAYLMFAVGMILATLGMYFAYYYVSVPPFAENILHVSQAESLDLLLVLNVMGIPGRFLPAFVADRLLGPTNTLVAVITLSGVLAFCWAGITSIQGLWVFVVFYGFFGASVQSLFPPAMAALTADPNKITTRVGMMFSIISVGCLRGAPMAGALIQNDGGRYLQAQMVVGSIMLLGAASVAGSRLSRYGLRAMVKC